MPATLTELQIGLLVAKFDRERDRYAKMAAVVQRYLQAELRANSIRCLVTSRAKDSQSLKGKLEKSQPTLDYDELSIEFGPHLLDLAGARVLLYEFPSDVDRTMRLIEEMFEIPAGPRYSKNFDEPRKYQARHRVAKLRADQMTDPELVNLRELVCEIQVVSLVKHVWNELEHDIKYKQPNGSPSDEQTAWLQSLWDTLQAAETSVQHLARVTQLRIAEATTRDVLDSPAHLFLAMRRLWGRPIAGNVDRLWELLDRTQHPLEPDTLVRLGIGSAQGVDSGRQAVAAAGFADPDDVESIVGKLAASHGRDFREIAATWRGRRTRLRSIIEALTAPAEGADATNG